MLHQKHNTKRSSSGGTTAPCPASTERVAVLPAHSAGMTLIELLVVITILTTLVAGVIPLLSPNNEPRKLREAARELQSYITQTQAEAARTGRPHGIGFRESTAGSGVALEVYQLEVPQPFAGFSDQSRVSDQGDIGNYVLPSDPTIPRFPEYAGRQLRQLLFELADGSSPDPYPPQFLRPGDEIVIDGRMYLIVQDENLPNPVQVINNTLYLQAPTNGDPVFVNCIWKNQKQGQLPPQLLKQYRIVRQPSNSPEPPLTLPRGIGIDMVASGLEVSGTLGLNQFTQFYDNAPGLLNTAGIMFAPSGRVESVLRNGERTQQLSRAMLLLGRVENVSPGRPAADYDFTQLTTDDQVETAREQLNWLNPDSHWLVLSANNGRLVSSGNRFVDVQSTAVQSLDYNGNTETLATDPFDQIYAARQFAREMRREGGR